MSKLKTILILSVILLLAITPLLYAQGRGGGHGGRTFGGGRFGGGYRGGYFGGGHFYGGRYWGYPWGWGLGWGLGLWGWPYWGWPYYGGAYLGWPYYPYYSDYYANVPPAAYGEPEQQQPYYWYYCQNPQGYYPYIQECPGGWMRVVPNTTPPSQFQPPASQ